MAEEENRLDAFERYVRELANYTGISEKQIRRIIDTIGARFSYSRSPNPEGSEQK